MGARKPRDSEAYKKQAFNRRGPTLVNSAFNFGQDCNTHVLLAFYDPYLGRYIGVQSAPPNIDWNEVAGTIRSEQIIEDGKIVYPTTRKRNKTTDSAQTKPTGVQQSSTATQPRRRGRPRKNNVPPRTTPSYPEPVSDMITVADDDDPSYSFQTVDKYRSQQISIHDIGSYSDFGDCIDPTLETGGSPTDSQSPISIRLILPPPSFSPDEQCTFEYFDFNNEAANVDLSAQPATLPAPSPSPSQSTIHSHASISPKTRSSLPATQDLATTTDRPVKPPALTEFFAVLQEAVDQFSARRVGLSTESYADSGVST